MGCLPRGTRFYSPISRPRMIGKGNREEPIKILIAEDEEDDVFCSNVLLPGLGLRSSFSSSGMGKRPWSVSDRENPQATAARSRSQWLLLLDLKMPKLDGFDVLKWLRQQPGLRRLSVVVFSSSNEPRDINLAYDLGANSYAVKPADPSSLLGFVQSLDSYWFKRNCFPDCVAS